MGQPLDSFPDSQQDSEGERHLVHALPRVCRAVEVAGAADVPESGSPAVSSAFGGGNARGSRGGESRF